MNTDDILNALYVQALRAVQAGQDPTDAYLDMTYAAIDNNVNRYDLTRLAKYWTLHHKLPQSFDYTRYIDEPEYPTALEGTPAFDVARKEFWDSFLLHLLVAQHRYNAGIRSRSSKIFAVVFLGLFSAIVSSFLLFRPPDATASFWHQTSWLIALIGLLLFSFVAYSLIKKSWPAIGNYILPTLLLTSLPSIIRAAVIESSHDTEDSYIVGVISWWLIGTIAVICSFWQKWRAGRHRGLWGEGK